MSSQASTRVRALVATVVAACLVAGGACLAAEPEKAFRDLCWGDPVEKLGRVVDVSAESDRRVGFEQFIKVNESYQLGPVTLTRITYGFFKRRLCMVELRGKGAADVFSEIAKLKYGTPLKSNQFITNEMYRSGDTACTVEENIVTGEAIMALFSVSIVGEMAQWHSEQVKAASEVF